MTLQRVRPIRRVGRTDTRPCLLVLFLLFVSSRFLLLFRFWLVGRLGDDAEAPCLPGGLLSPERVGPRLGDVSHMTYVSADGLLTNPKSVGDLLLTHARLHQLRHQFLPVVGR